MAEEDAVEREAVGHLTVVLLVVGGEEEGVGWGLGLSDGKEVLEDFYGEGVGVWLEEGHIGWA